MYVCLNTVSSCQVIGCLDVWKWLEVAGECISNAGDFNMAISATHLSLKAEKLHPPDIQACLWDAMSLKKVASKGKELKCLISERCG